MRLTRNASLLFALGLMVVFIAERLLSRGTGALVTNLAGCLLILGAIAGAIAGRRKIAGPALRLLLPLFTTGLVAVLSQLFRETLRFSKSPLAQTSPRLDGVLAVLSPTLVLVAILPTLLVNLSLRSLARAPVLDQRRLKRSLYSGLSCAFVLVFAAATYFAASTWNVKRDFSFFRTARPGTATKALVKTFMPKVEVSLFFPPANEVAEAVAGYFADLSASQDNLAIAYLDHAVDPAKAKALGVFANGSIVLARGPLREIITLPLKLEQARPRLRSLDQDIYKRLVSVTREKRVAYLVQGHEEKAFGSSRTDDPADQLSKLKELLALQNFDPKEIGLGQGLGNELPKDAGLVLLVGPRQPLLAEEQASLLHYAENDGNLLVALDPDAADTAHALLLGLGLRMAGTTLANDRNYWARTRQVSDRVGIATANYQTHPALGTLSGYRSQMPMIFLAAGYLEKAGKPGAAQVDFIVQSDETTWNDVNGNFHPDDGAEKRSAYSLVAAVTQSKPRKGRALVMSDSDALTDRILINRGNTIFALDAFRWLAGDSEPAGTITSEVDVPVQHTRKQDLAWFYGSVFAAPILILALGMVATQRKKRERRTGKGGHR